MKKLLWLTLPALALSACHKDTDTTQGMTASQEEIASGDAATIMATDSAQPDSSGAAQGTDAATYLAKAGAGDLFEIESSRAILKTTKNGQIADFARMMIKDHEASTAMLKKAAKAANIDPAAPQLEPDQQQTLDAIKATKGMDADKAYLDAQHTGHTAALALHQAYAADGSSEPLKAAAAKIAPVVQQHIDMLDKIAR